MAERERRLGEATRDTVMTAWKSLVDRCRQDSATGHWHWTDNEADTGLLKDMDGLNTIMEPFLLTPSNFVEPALGLDEIEARVQTILSQLNTSDGSEGVLQQYKGVSGDEKKVPVYKGFTSAPYPYVQVEVDYVDSAATVLRLICNLVRMSEVLQRPLTVNEKSLATTACLAADFLLDARVEDEKGVRWQGIKRETEPKGRFANLFFTHAACMALHNAVQRPSILRWLGPDRHKEISALFPQVITWVAGQYEPATRAFWMDADRSVNQPVGAVYALELIYSLVDTLTKTLRTYCSDALGAVLRRMTDLPKASALQTDFYHTVPLPTGGIGFYDDRRYIGSFLSLMALAKSKDPEVINDDFIRAGQVLFQGVTDEWIDEPTNLWDDGRPLICYSQDALIGLVRHALEGAVGELTLRENDLRTAIRQALQSDDVVSTIFDTVMERALSLKEKEIITRMSGAAKGPSR